MTLRAMPQKTVDQLKGFAMGQSRKQPGKQSADRPLVWLCGEVKSPPFSSRGRQEAGMLLRLLQRGEWLSMPHAEALPQLGARCGVLRVRDEAQNWRIVYRIDTDAILILDVYSKKTRKIPDEVFVRCRQRLNQFDRLVKNRRQKSQG